MLDAVRTAFYQMGRTSYAEGNGAVAPVLPQVSALLDDDEEQTVRNLFAQGYFDAASEAVRGAAKPLLRYVEGRLE